MIDSQTLEKLYSIDDRSWGAIYKELVRYSAFKLNKAGFEIRTEKDSINAEHFVTEAITKTFEGIRKWDFNRFPDITIHLKGVVKSLISSHFKSSTKSIVTSGKVNEDKSNLNEEETLNDGHSELLSDDARTTESPEQVLITTEDWSKIESSFGLDNDGYVIYCEWLEGNPPRDIAEGLGIPVSEVYNSIKKGKRIVVKLFNKQS